MKFSGLSSLLTVSTCVVELVVTGCSAGADSKAPSFNGAASTPGVGGAGAGGSPGVGNVGGAGALPGDPPVIVIAPVGTGPGGSRNSGILTTTGGSGKLCGNHRQRSSVSCN